MVGGGEVRHSVFNHSVTTVSRVFLEQLIVPHKAKNFSALYGLRMFIAVFTRARQLSLF